MSYFSAAQSSPKSESGFFGTAPAALPHHAPLRPNDNDNTPGRRSPSRRSQRAAPSPIRAAAILVAFLPVPPTLSVIYMACGHGILRAAHPAHYRAVPLTSSVSAAAVGGAILSLPLAVLLYLLLFPTKPPDPEDFFDDEEDGGGLLSTYGAYAVCSVLLLVLGAISGALGTVCLPANNLSAAEAAEAGIVGGTIICGALAVVASAAFIFWGRYWRPKSRTLADSSFS
ncbi:hypothetical protein B0H17DRAFT_1043859 [Mycena rosella]|uniref:Uncharacterized protein n=1 Tax=Mycena rosella TaxID=1033263 RepID=A0AAD7GQ16_MYCRO|nr:hypothetical protein B0H17DRAFT_1043859 [Mycena rosella]